MHSHIKSLIEDFAIFDDWEERYAYLIDIGKSLPPMHEALKTNATLVSGCTSRVWMICKVEDNLLKFQADSDAHIVRGLICILVKIFNEQPVRILKEVDMKDIFQQMGLDNHLSPNRRNGFFSMIERLYLETDSLGGSSEG